jgi:hypothetical protein
MTISCAFKKMIVLSLEQITLKLQEERKKLQQGLTRRSMLSKLKSLWKLNRYLLSLLLSLMKAIIQLNPLLRNSRLEILKMIIKAVRHLTWPRERLNTSLRKTRVNYWNQIFWNRPISSKIREQSPNQWLISAPSKTQTPTKIKLTFK